MIVKIHDQIIDTLYVSYVSNIYRNYNINYEGYSFNFSIQLNTKDLVFTFRTEVGATIIRDQLIKILDEQYLNGPMIDLDKPVETTKEQPKLDKDLKIKIMNIMTKHVDLRNSDKITDKDLYHSFLDWEKEVWEVLLG